MGIKAVLDTLISRGTKKAETKNKQTTAATTTTAENWNAIFPISIPVPLTDHEIQNGRLEVLNGRRG